jgi:hypothetical protein
VGYNVVYEYAGKQYTVQMPADPGPTLRLQLTPVGANSTQGVAANGTVVDEPAPAVVYREVYVQPYYPPPVGIVFGVGVGGWGGWGHRRWR